MVMRKFFHYATWFNRFEKVIHHLDSSYYAGKAANTAIHIDIESPIATNPTWGRLTHDERQCLMSFDEKTQTYQKLLEILKPDIVVVSVGQDKLGKVLDWNKAKLIKEYKVPRKKIAYYHTEKSDVLFGTNMRGMPFGSLSGNEISDFFKELDL